jgi:hypothetical protein
LTCLQRRIGAWTLLRRRVPVKLNCAAHTRVI